MRIGEWVSIVLIILIIIVLILIVWVAMTGDYRCPVRYENRTIEEVSCSKLDCEALGCKECFYYQRLVMCDCSGMDIINGRCS